MAFNLQRQDSNLFLMRRLAKYGIIVDTGKIYYFSPRDTYSGPSEVTVTDFSGEGDGPISAFNVESKTFTSIRNSGKIYVQIVTGAGFDPYSILMDISDANGQPVADYHFGSIDASPQYMGAVIQKGYGVFEANIIFQEDDPESIEGTGAKNTDESTGDPFAGGQESPYYWASKTHILIGEVFYNEIDKTMSFKQYHRGPLFFEIPFIFYGDQDFRPRHP